MRRGGGGGAAAHNPFKICALIGVTALSTRINNSTSSPSLTSFVGSPSPHPSPLPSSRATRIRYVTTTAATAKLRLWPGPGPGRVGDSGVEPEVGKKQAHHVPHCKQLAHRCVSSWSSWHGAQGKFLPSSLSLIFASFSLSKFGGFKVCLMFVAACHSGHQCRHL